MLIITIILPSIGALILITYQGFTCNVVIRILALTVSIITFILSIILWLEFDASTSDYQFTHTYIKGLVSLSLISLLVLMVFLFILYYLLLSLFLFV